MSKSKDTRFPSVRTSADQIRRLTRAAEILDTPTSEFVRKAVDKELDRLARRHPELRKAA